MLKSGKTPLLRVHKLEKLFDVGEIYIKLEGVNPAGHKHDRIAEVLVRDAIAHKYKGIVVNGSVSYINSVLYYADLESLDIVIPLFKGERWKTGKFKDKGILDLRSLKYGSQLEIVTKTAEDKNYYLAAEGYTNIHISQIILENLTDEIVTKLNYKVDAIYTQLSYGYTLTSIHNSLLKKWMNGEIEKFPSVICGTWGKGNAAFKNFQRTKEIKNNVLEGFRNEELSRNHILLDKGLLEQTFLDVNETDGKIISINEELLKESVEILRQKEHIKINKQEAYSFAAFYKLVKEKKIKKGRHVIILNEGKCVINVENLNDYDEVSKDKLVKLTREYLVQYSDSVLETEDAIKNAIDKGFILLASRDGVYEGVCVIVNLGFEEFIPKYHLAYIGANKASKGRGVGTELIQRAIDLTDGNLSLHVDLDNKGAKRLYKKLGFKHVYNRMIYCGEV
ncbi:MULTISPECIES: pyridoxal-phosphate dependent enzyme [Psychrilyobacter]|uniref:Pyridoxal-phosphate dependent enzyme n=1 Tax=Psychrilyobacter piezotolerans TaxID=2293438 RepID=A0ABX9KD56_9FUSO|nr:MULTISPECIES: pyridoxal-phosphate dependent enzyme [Psychrilyobacter]MCS5423116.1 pyridoxal-phosphate dependent enzyme [Psychrilyobacter sp. S5]NDI76579.1 pyridoxal-phosphate dependent enzyme [Psychrilyobacter piezotolerans]RDE58895.1 pyridoxal-phosphate dependent enzyme [Psychrilyobacter sp. S5]REI39407.1 pyridoxal-phosphate dependent enzyme [Psychrilyobacter piezotolerans]